MKEILKNKKILIPIATIILAVIILGVSYAYFSANLTETNKTESVIQTKELKIAFDGTQEIEALNITPGWSAEKKFTVENLTNSKTAFNIYLQNITNEFDSELIYSLYETDSTGNVIETLVDKEVLPQTNADKSYLYNDIEIASQPTKKYYTLKIEFEYKDTPQNEYQGAHFRATVGVDAAARKDVGVIGDKIDASSITNGGSVTKQFSVMNYSNNAKNYDLELSDIVNTYATGLTYSLNKNGTEVISSTAMPTTDTTLLRNQTIAAGAKDIYEMIITYDTTQANASGFRLLANEVNTFTANVIVSEVAVNKEISGDSLLSLVSGDIKNGTYVLNVNNNEYRAHVYNIKGNQTWDTAKTFGEAEDCATASTDAKNMVIVKVNGNLTIESSGSVGPYYTEYGGPKGFLLYVTGTLTNNGTIDNSHGAKAAGQYVYLWKNANGEYELINPVGGAGVNGGKKCGSFGTFYCDGTAGQDGSKVGKRDLGGGGVGATYTYSNNYSYTGTSSAATSYSGGTGSGAGAETTGGSSASNGGAGGTGKKRVAGINETAGNGVGNPSGGTGGLLVIYANDIYNNVDSYITAKGTSAANTTLGGGSSGGGSINIFYNNNYNNSGTINADGGGSIGTRTKGGAGGRGTVNIGRIIDGQYCDVSACPATD